jgi:hypothetical protein
MLIQDFQNQITYLRSARSQVAAENAQIAEFKTQYEGTILSFNSASGFYTVRLEDGRVVYAKSVSNSGGSGAGSSVSVYFPRGGMPMLDWL